MARKDHPQAPEAGQPRYSARTAADKAARRARLAQEMRTNLLKRKAQQRAQRERGKPADT
jgi:hypothetical protein